MPVVQRTQATIDAMNTTDWRGTLASQQDTIARLEAGQEKVATE